MKARNCPYCNTPMVAETKDVPKEIKLPIVGAYSIESYLPDVIRSYSTYTAYVCNQCGKLEVFLNKSNASIPFIEPLKFGQSIR